MRTALLVMLALVVPGLCGSRASADLPGAPSAVESTIDLAVPGYRDAVVVVAPDGAPRPVIVATHGSWDRAEAHCDLWRAIVRGRAFVVCPRGEPTRHAVPSGEELFYYRDQRALGREVAAAFAALRARFGDRVDAREPIYAGFSQGAIQGAVMLPASDVAFARAALVEGGHLWSARSAERFAARGGDRVAFVCGTKSCDDAARTAAAPLEAAHVATRIAYAPGAGHTYGGDVADELRDAFAWLVEGDARFRNP